MRRAREEVPPKIRRARRLRQNETRAETLMWDLVRDRRFLDLKFRRQCPFGRFVLDFFCEEINLAVELVGAPHLWPHVMQRDAVRAAFLQSRGITIVPIHNDELFHNPRDVFARLERTVKALRSTVPRNDSKSL